MLAIVLDENQHSRKVLGNLLSTLGFTQILEADNIDEFDFYCKQHASKIRLIISDYQANEGLDLPLSRIVIKNKDLDLTPLIYMTDRGLQFTLNFQRSRFSRIDSYLHRPFGVEGLKEAIAKAHERRASFRNVLIIYGKKLDTAAIEATYRENNTSHWKEAVFVETLDDLKKKYQEYGFKIGGMLFDPTHFDPSLDTWLSKIKKEQLGSSIVIGTLSKNSKETFPFRVYSDLFFDADLDWESVLDQISHRLVFDWRSKNILKRVKEQLKQKNLKETKQILKIADKKSLKRWELLEASGSLLQALGKNKSAIKKFREALEINPCLPSVYLQLIQNPECEKATYLKMALEYCPNHPQIKNLTESLSHDQR